MPSLLWCATMSEKDSMFHCKLFIIGILLFHIKIIRASWPLALAPAPSSMWPGVRVLPPAGLAQASLIQPIALRDMQLAYPVQPLSISQFSPMGAELASEQEILNFQRNQHRRRLHRERERLRLREREHRLRHRNMHPFPLPILRSERNRSNNLLDSLDLPEATGKTRGSPDENNDNRQPGERIKASSDEDFVMMQKLNNEHIKTTNRPVPFEDQSNSMTIKQSINGQVDMMPPDPPTKPVDIRRKTMAAPNGQVTYITEMLYDVGDGNGNLKMTRPPGAPSFIPAPNDVLSYAPTDDPRMITIIPPATGVLSRPPNVPVADWHNMPTPPTPFRSRSRASDKNEQTEGSERRESNSIPTDRSGNRDENNNFHAHHRHVQTERPNGYRSSSYGPTNKQSFDLTKASSTTKEKTWKGSGEGLGAAAIAGIVIGSLVSITLLAGNSFVPHVIMFCRKKKLQSLFALPPDLTARRFSLLLSLPSHSFSHFLSLSL